MIVRAVLLALIVLCAVLLVQLGALLRVVAVVGIPALAVLIALRRVPAWWLGF